MVLAAGPCGYPPALNPFRRSAGMNVKTFVTDKTILKTDVFNTLGVLPGLMAAAGSPVQRHNLRHEDLKEAVIP